MRNSFPLAVIYSWLYNIKKCKSCITGIFHLGEYGWLQGCRKLASLALWCKPMKIFGRHFLAGARAQLKNIVTLSGCQPELATKKGGCLPKLSVSQKIPKNVLKYAACFQTKNLTHQKIRSIPHDIKAVCNLIIKQKLFSYSLHPYIT